MNRKKLSGLLLVLGSLQFLVLLSILEATEPNYSAVTDTISGLGIGQNAVFFSAAIIVLGLLTLASGLLLYKGLKSRAFTALMFLAGTGSIGVAVFPLTAGLIHLLAAFFVFLLGTIAELVSAKFEKGALKAIYILLEIISLLGLALTIVGIGPIGFTERRITHPILVWGIIFGIRLIRE